MQDLMPELQGRLPVRVQLQVRHTAVTHPPTHPLRRGGPS